MKTLIFATMNTHCFATVNCGSLAAPASVCFSLFPSVSVFVSICLVVFLCVSICFCGFVVGRAASPPPPPPPAPSLPFPQYYYS